MSRKRLTTEGFIQKAKEKHGNKYDYSLVEYKTAHIKVKIICPEHGIFIQKAYVHLNGCACKKCGREKVTNGQKLTLEEFIKKSIKIHDNKYDYSLVEYVKGRINVKIICPIHGVFEQKPCNHLIGYGCQICGQEKVANDQRSTTEEFIEKSRKIHSDKYNYSLVEYVNNSTKVKIICNKHGVFEQTPNKHLLGRNCPECSKYYGDINEKSLYILYDEKEKLYKIGRSKNIKKRLKDIYVNKKDKNRLEIIKEYKKCGELECIIHKKYDKQRVNHTFYDDGFTEWFNLTKEQIDEIDKNIKSKIILQ